MTTATLAKPATETKRPVIELKKITINIGMSEETNCYSADLYVDGLKAGTVGNHGHGGCDMVRLVAGFDERELNDQIKATYPKRPYNFGPGHVGEFETDLESLCGEIVGKHIYTKDLKRKMRSKVLVLEGPDQIMEYSWKGVRTIDAARIAAFKTQKPHLADKVMNDWTDEQIAATYPND